MKLTQIKDFFSNYTFIGMIVLILLSCAASHSFKDSLLGGGITSFNGLNLILITAISNLIFIYAKRKLNNVVLGIMGVSFLASILFITSLFATSVRPYIDFATFTNLLLILSVSLFAYTLSVKGKALRWIALALAVITLYFGFMGETFTILPTKASSVMFSKISTALNVNYIDIRPDFQASYSVWKQSLTTGKSVLGTGPGHYNLAFDLYKPSNVINSNYYNYSPTAGYSNLLTMATELGLIVILVVALAIYSIYRQAKNWRQIVASNFDGFIYKTVFGWSLLSLLGFIFINNTLVNLIMLAACTSIGIAVGSRGVQSLKTKTVVIAMMAISLICILIGVMKYYSTSKLSSALSTASSIENLTSTLNNISLPIYTNDYYDVKTLANILAIKQTLESTSTDTDTLKSVFTSNVQTAIENSTKSIASNPTNYKSYINRGLVYEYSMLLDKDGGYKEARSNYEKAAALNPSNPEIYTMIANLENYYGNATSSLQFAGQSITVKPNYTNGYIQLALIFKNLGDNGKVAEALEYALASSPTDVNIAKALADVYQQIGQSDKASVLYTQIDQYNAAIKAAQEGNQ